MVHTIGLEKSDFLRLFRRIKDFFTENYINHIVFDIVKKLFCSIILKINQ